MNKSGNRKRKKGRGRGGEEQKSENRRKEREMDEMGAQGTQDGWRDTERGEEEEERGVWRYKGEEVQAAAASDRVLARKRFLCDDGD